MKVQVFEVELPADCGPMTGKDGWEKAILEFVAQEQERRGVPEESVYVCVASTGRRDVGL